MGAKAGRQEREQQNPSPNAKTEIEDVIEALAEGADGAG